MSKKYTSLEHMIRNVVSGQIDENYEVRKHPVYGNVIGKEGKAQLFSQDKASDLADKHNGSLLKAMDGKRYVVKLPEHLPNEHPLKEGVGVGGSDKFDNTQKAFLTRKYDSKVGGHSAAGQGAAANMKTSDTMNTEAVSGTKDREEVEFVDRKSDPKSSKSKLGKEASIKSIYEAMAQIHRNVNEAKVKKARDMWKMEEEHPLPSQSASDDVIGVEPKKDKKVEKKDEVKKAGDDKIAASKGQTAVDLKPNLQRVSGSELDEKKNIKENRLISSFINFHKK